MTDTEPIGRGGRGARERILRAAAELFAQEGVHATGIARLTRVAHVSTRTLYQHFPSKNALVAAYLRQFVAGAQPTAAAKLERDDLAPRARLLELFLEPATPSGTVARGCPFHNAAVEAAGTMPEVTELVEQYKRAFTERIAEVAADAGARDPGTLARRLALLFEGASALSTSLNAIQPMRDAHELATVLIDDAITPTRERSPAGHPDDGEPR